MASAISGDFTILHCNNEASLEPEMKIQISKSFYETHGDLEDPDSWAIGFEETDAGFEKAFPSSDLDLDFTDDDDECKLTFNHDSYDIWVISYDPFYMVL